MNFVLAGRSIGAVLGRGAGSASGGLLTGLVAYWKLDEASGNAIDAHSNALTLTAANAPGNSTGKVYSTARTLGVFTWAYSEADVEDAGDFDVQFTAAYSAGATPAKTFVAAWRVRGSIEVTP